jgi:hypothetical protein
MELPMGLSREKIVEFAQVNALKALRRFCVIVFVNDPTLSPPARMRFLMLLQSKLGSYACNSAATPVT